MADAPPVISRAIRNAFSAAPILRLFAQLKNDHSVPPAPTCLSLPT